MTTKRWLSLLAAVLMTLALTACGGDKKPTYNTPDGCINAVEYGVDNTGKTDMTDKITALHKDAAKQGKMVYYPNGTYIFNGATLDFTGGVRFESIEGVRIRNSKVDTNIINFDDAGNLIGLMHNHLEQKYNDPDFEVHGNLVAPPAANTDYETVVDVVPYWYNDFGRACTLAGGHGWRGWYDWQWNHHDIGTTCQAQLPAADGSEETVTCGAKLPISDDPYVLPTCPECGAQSTTDQYDPDLHPLLGWYRGDTVEVLDWQTYWLQEYGVKQSILLAGWDTQTWSDPSNGSHWVYNLLNNTPNAKTMKFALQVSSSNYGSSETEIRRNWFGMFYNFYFNEEYKDMVYCYEVDGKRYPVINLWDEQSIRYSLNQNNNNVIMLYKDVATSFKAMGYDGVCITARTALFSGEAMAASRAELAAAGVIWFSSAYPSNAIGAGATFPERVEAFLPFEDDYTVYGAATAAHTHDPHPSQWVCPGHTPAVFSSLMRKIVTALTERPNQPRMITVYNVSEWSEGGPGLVPTVGQGFGYLEAIRDNVVIKK